MKHGTGTLKGSFSGRWLILTVDAGRQDDARARRRELLLDYHSVVCDALLYRKWDGELTML